MWTAGGLSMDLVGYDKEILSIYEKLLKGLNTSEARILNAMPSWQQLYYLQKVLDERNEQLKVLEKKLHDMPTCRVVTSDEEHAINFLDYYNIPWAYRKTNGYAYLSAAEFDVTLIWDQYQKLSSRYRDISDHEQNFLSVDPVSGEKALIMVMSPYMDENEVSAVLKLFKELELSPYSVYGNKTSSFVRKIPVEE